MKKIVLSVVAALCLAGCSVPGKMVFKKVGDKFECIEVYVDRDNVTSSDIQKIEERLNEK